MEVNSYLRGDFVDCKDCYERKRANHWFKVSLTLFSIIGGIVGAFGVKLLINLFGN